MILTFCFISDKLTPLVLSSQPKLLSVNASNNIIQDTQPGAFTNMSRLVRLILTKNKITKLDPLSLSGTVCVNKMSVILTLKFICRSEQSGRVRPGQ